MAPTFRERYCHHWSIPLEEFEHHLFVRVLYPQGRLLRPFLGHAFFAPDREFLRNVGDIRSRRFFHAEAEEFHSAEENRSMLRRWFRVRVSTERVRVLMEACWARLDSAAPLAVSAR